MAKSGPDASRDTFALVEQAYSASLDPEAYDLFMDAWTTFIEDFPVFASDDPTTAIVEAHFQRGLDLLERLGRARKAKLSADAIVRHSPTAAIVFETSGAIVAFNDLAKVAFQVSIDSTLSDLKLSQHVKEDIAEWALNRSDRYLLLQHPTDDGEKLSLLAARTMLPISPDDLNNSALQEYVLLSSTNIVLSSSAISAIVDTFGLSKSEAEVARLLVQGLTPAKIAARRKLSINTIRTQIKALLRKLDAKNASDLVRILCGFAVNLSHGDQQKRPFLQNSNTRVHRFKLSEGRQIAVVDQGDERGRPVLFFHSMLNGTQLPQAAIETCARKGWRVIAPSRPGYGLSDSNIEQAGEQLVDQTADDFARIIERLELEKVIVLGHMQGSIYAQRFAIKYPKLLNQLLFVSHAPYWSPELVKKLPKRQRIIAQTTRYAPSALRFVTRAGVALIDSGRHDKFLNALHKDNPTDMRALRRPDVYDSARRGLDHTIRNGSEAFCADCPIVLQDWSGDGKKVRAPISILIGEDDKVATKDYVEGYTAAVAGVEVEFIKGAGQHLLFSHWPAVLKQLEKLSKAALVIE